MSILGKTSVGVRCRTIGVISKRASAATMKVYGRVRAIRTIHMHPTSMELQASLRLKRAPATYCRQGRPAETQSNHERILKLLRALHLCLLGCRRIPARYIDEGKASQRIACRESCKKGSWGEITICVRASYR